ncbi:MAG TPA: 1,4-dihydroxy-6-naphthoate synthase [Chitinophagales bacterium]|nr:1,4-dihydroxy-6-naphthoate synthase [Chitinophagales bacterium]
MNLNIGFSPCPNDTFIFYALLHGKIDTQGLSFTALLADVETLNRKAFNAELEITKLSFAAYLQLQQHYRLLTSGSALGNNCGPLLIAKKNISPESMHLHSVAIPGNHTTANFLFDTFFPHQAGKVEMVFSEIERAVLDEITDTGVIIHENRFTYQQKGLKKVADLGEKWEQSTGHPIPLGGIAILRSIAPAVATLVNQLIRESVLYAFAHPEEAIGYVRLHSQEMEEAVMWQHIHLYVNDYSIHLGEKGKAAIDHFFDHALQRKMIDEKIIPVFVE